MTESKSDIALAYREAVALASLSGAIARNLTEYEAGHEGIAEMPVYAFAVIGEAIAQNWINLPDLEKRAVFDRIEHLMRVDHQLVQDAVATGLIEALVSKVDLGELKVDDVWLLAGQETKRYWREWNRFCGVVPPRD